MSDADDIEFTVETFKRVIAHERHRLEVGTSLRRWLHQQLAQGIEPDHYRTKWLNQGISRIIHQLELYGREFNTAHPNDKFSTGDMIDVAESVVLTLKHYLGHIEEEVDVIVDLESN